MSDTDRTQQRHGGSAGGGGYNYQSAAIAYVASHVLTEEPLQWVNCGAPDVPVSVATETGGCGDDLKIWLQCDACIEVQAKKGLSKRQEFWEALLRLASGLADTPTLHGALLVDTTASSTIRTDLRLDLLRLSDGRSDDLKEITTQVASRFAASGLDLAALAQRLRIVVADLGPSSTGAQLGSRQLSEVLADHSMSSAAWGLLVKDGLDLVTRRGRQDAAALAQFLAEHNLPLSRAARNLAVLAESFMSWVVSTNESFTITGLGVALPIERAWMKLAVMAEDVEKPDVANASLHESIARYHEWERLRYEHRAGESTNAELVVEFAHRVMVIGGPGAGKSTLLRRLAHRLSAERKTTLKVRLPLMATRMTRMGEGFDVALMNVAAEGSGIPAEDLRRVAADPFCILADGLDECDPNRSDMAEALVKYAAAHRQTRIVVTTRPVGHDPGVFYGWKHYELLPLKKEDIHEYADLLFQTCMGAGAAGAQEHLVLFQKRLDTSAAASVAARNPLMLGFLVRLTVSGIDWGHDRASLYGSVIDLMQRTPPQERSATVNVEKVVASRCIELFGWLLKCNPATARSQLIAQAGEKLGPELGVPALEAASRVEKALLFWEDRRLMERLTVGVHEAATFVHMALCEFAAARYAARLPYGDLSAWLTEVRMEPTWRETILLTASTGSAENMVEILLELDSPDDPLSEDVLLAADVLAQATRPSAHVAQRVAEPLVGRIVSEIRSIAYEAGSALLPLTQIVPEIIGTKARSLMDHEQPWTRYVALALALRSGEEYVDIDLLDGQYESLPEQGFWVSRTRPGLRDLDHDYHLRRACVVDATELLLERRSGPEVMAKIERVVLEGRLPMGVMSDLTKVLRAKGYEDIVRRHNQKLRDILSDRFWDWQPGRQADRALLEGVIGAFAEIPLPSHRVARGERVLNLSALLKGMRVGEVIAGNHRVFAQRRDVESLHLVVRATAKAIGLDEERLVAEAHDVLMRMEEDSESCLYSFVEDVDVTPQWPTVADADIDPQVLGRALDHPSHAVAQTAAEMLFVGVGGQEAVRVAKQVLSSGGQTGLRMVAAIASRIWGDRALGMVLDRLDGDLTAGCEYLFMTIPSLAGREIDSRVCQCLARGILDGPLEVARGAAKALSEVDLPETYAGVLRRAFEHWRKHEPPHPQGGGVIPHSPRADLLKAGVSIDAFSFVELTRFCSDVRDDVREAAVAALADAAEADLSVLSSLLTMIASGELPVTLFRELMALPRERLSEASAQMVDMLRSSLAAVREAATGSLDRGWLEPTDSERLAVELLGDADCGVRDQAAKALRRMRRRKAASHKPRVRAGQLP